MKAIVLELDLKMVRNEKKVASLSEEQNWNKISRFFCLCVCFYPGCGSTSKQNGVATQLTWRKTTSHELTETLVDAYIYFVVYLFSDTLLDEL